MQYLSSFTTSLDRVPLELANFGRFNEAGWDGADASPVLQTCVDAAKQFLESLEVVFPVGDAMPGSDGSIGIYWQNGEAELYVDFRADGRKHFYYTDGHAESVEEVLAPETSIADLIEAVKPAFSYVRSTSSFRFDAKVLGLSIDLWWVADPVVSTTNYALAA